MPERVLITPDLAPAAPAVAATAASAAAAVAPDAVLADSVFGSELPSQRLGRYLEPSDSILATCVCGGFGFERVCFLFYCGETCSSRPVRMKSMIHRPD